MWWVLLFWEVILGFRVIKGIWKKNCICYLKFWKRKQWKKGLGWFVGVLCKLEISWFDCPFELKGTWKWICISSFSSTLVKVWMERRRQIGDRESCCDGRVCWKWIQQVILLMMFKTMFFLPHFFAIKNLEKFNKKKVEFTMKNK